MKPFMGLMLVAILGALAGAGLFMLRKGRGADGTNKAMARALALRVGLSIALFLFVLLSWHMGWVRPGGVPVGP
jgi:hypothetical protein